MAAATKDSSISGGGTKFVHQVGHKFVDPIVLNNRLRFSVGVTGLVKANIKMLANRNRPATNIHHC